MKVTICDRCGKKIGFLDRLFIVKVPVLRRSYTWCGELYKVKGKHELCHLCKDDFYAFLEHFERD